MSENIYHRASQAWALFNPAHPDNLTPPEKQQLAAADRLDAILADLIATPIDQWRKGKLSATQLVGRILDAAGES